MIILSERVDLYRVGRINDVAILSYGMFRFTNLFFKVAYTIVPKLPLSVVAICAKYAVHLPPSIYTFATV